MLLRLLALTLTSALAITSAGCGSRTAQLQRDGGAGVERDTSPTPPRDGGPGSPDVLPTICKSWSCWEQKGRTYCHNPQNPGLPGIGFWSCHIISAPHRAVPTWRCRGAVPKGGLIEPVVPCSANWTCTLFGVTDQHDVYSCEKPDDALDRPPPELSKGRTAICFRGSAWGTRCELVDAPPPSPPWREVPSGTRCPPGARIWCNALSFGGWGRATCGANGRWPTKLVSGKALLDCQARADGRVPDSACSCYHLLAPSPSCCERIDCLIPEGSDGRTCDPSPGEICDYCNPQKPECAAGSVCLVNKAGESYCTASCDAASCAANFDCVLVQDIGSKQCLPADLSCYF